MSNKRKQVKDYMLCGGLLGHKFSTNAYSLSPTENQTYTFEPDGIDRGYYPPLGGEVCERINIEGRITNVDLSVHLEDFEVI